MIDNQSWSQRPHPEGSALFERFFIIDGQHRSKAMELFWLEAMAAEESTPSPANRSERRRRGKRVYHQWSDRAAHRRPPTAKTVKPRKSPLRR